MSVCYRARILNLNEAKPLRRRARSTNFLRPIYRLGWLVIWGLWLVAVVLAVPALMPADDVVGWGFVSLGLTALAYLIHRYWDWLVVGRPFSFRRLR